MTREIVLRIPEERAGEMLLSLTAGCAAAADEYPEHHSNNLAELADLLQRAVDEAAQERLRREVE